MLQGNGGFFTSSPLRHGAGFMVEGITSSGAAGGTLRIVGLANSVTKFREDRRVSMHLTPFTERCAAVQEASLPQDLELSGAGRPLCQHTPCRTFVLA